jgi:hypothetical protein
VTKVTNQLQFIIYECAFRVSNYTSLVTEAKRHAEAAYGPKSDRLERITITLDYAPPQNPVMSDCVAADGRMMTPCTNPRLSTCPTCGAEPTEDCPYTDLTPGLLESAPVTAGTAGVCEDGDVWEACQ